MKILLLNQTFWPDVVATSQQLTMLARRLTDRGHEVMVIAGRRGYDNQKLIFPRRERWQGIEISRISSLSLGKASRWRRSLNFGSFLLTCAGRLLFTPEHDVVIALTSPPLISWIGSLFTRFKGGKLIFWAMDLNPDEAIAAGWLKEKSLTARLLARLLQNSLVQAEAIVALDRFMKERIAAKGIDEAKIEVIPPARDDGVRHDLEGREEFRRQHGLTDKFVVMYAGNHSPCNPLETLLESAAALDHRQDIIFLFAGGGSTVSQVKQFAAARGLANVRCLPYEPYERLSALLSAADLHVVVMGDAFRGILHPSKIYNILAVGSPFLFIGPEESHVMDLVRTMDGGPVAVHARHGESQNIARMISETADRRPGFTSMTDELDEFSGDRIYGKFIEMIEYAGARPAAVGRIEAAAPASEG